MEILQIISASTHLVRKHGFEYTNLREIEDNPIIFLVLENGNNLKTF